MTAPTITRMVSGTVVLRFPYHKFLVESLKLEVPAYERGYEPATRAWTITSTYASTAFRLMSAVFPDVEVVDAAAGPLFDRTPRASEDPWMILHLRPTAPPELVTAAHRCLAKINHPDAGGNVVTMQEINAAVDRIRGAR